MLGRTKVKESLTAGRVSELPPSRRSGPGPGLAHPTRPTLLRRQLCYHLLFVRIFGGSAAHLCALPPYTLKEVFLATYSF